MSLCWVAESVEIFRNAERDRDVFGMSNALRQLEFFRSLLTLRDPHPRTSGFDPSTEVTSQQHRKELFVMDEPTIKSEDAEKACLGNSGLSILEIGQVKYLAQLGSFDGQDVAFKIIARIEAISKAMKSGVGSNVTRDQGDEVRGDRRRGL